MEDGGNAIVGNVTQHASMIAADWKPAPTERRAAEDRKRPAGAQFRGTPGHERAHARHAGPAAGRDEMIRRWYRVGIRNLQITDAGAR